MISRFVSRRHATLVKLSREEGEGYF
ncbi:MAG: hypothetical protein AB4042_08180 [Leptolyngbyaceae cyanobacterium]